MKELSHVDSGEYLTESEQESMALSGDMDRGFLLDDGFDQSGLALHALAKERRRRRRGDLRREKLRREERRGLQEPEDRRHEIRRRFEDADFQERLEGNDDAVETIRSSTSVVLDYLGEQKHWSDSKRIGEVFEHATKVGQLQALVNLDLSELFTFFYGGEAGSHSRDYFHSVVGRAESMIAYGFENADGTVEYPEPWHIELYLRRGALKAAMIDTPEYGAYMAARKIIEQDGVAVADNFPEVDGYGSDVHPRYSHDYDEDESRNQYRWQIGDWRDIIRGYESVSRRVRARNPELSGEELEHRCVVETGRMFVRAGQYGILDRRENSPYVGPFREAMAYAQLDYWVGERARGIRRSSWYSMPGLERFIGKSGTSRKLWTYMGERRSIRGKLRELEEGDDEQRAKLLESANQEEIEKQERWVARERERINRKYDKIISKLESERRRAEKEEERAKELREIEEDYVYRVKYYSERTIGEYSDDLHKRLEVVERRVERRKSLADKAIDLMLATKDESWVNRAGFGEIKRAHRKLREGVPVRAIECMRVAEIVAKEVAHDRDGISLYGRDIHPGFEIGLSSEYSEEKNLEILRMGADPRLIAELEKRWGNFAEEELPDICRMTRGNSVAWLRNDSLVREMEERFGRNGLLTIMARGGDLAIAKEVADAIKMDGQSEKGNILEIAAWSAAGMDFLRKQHCVGKNGKVQLADVIGREIGKICKNGVMSRATFVALGDEVIWAAGRVYYPNSMTDCIDEASILGEANMLRLRRRGCKLDEDLRKDLVSLCNKKPDDENLQKLREKIMAIADSGEWEQAFMAIADSDEWRREWREACNKLITQELLTLNEILGEVNMLKLCQKGYVLRGDLRKKLLSLYDENPDDEKLEGLKERITAIVDGDEWQQASSKLITQEALIFGGAKMLRLRQRGYELDRGLSEELVSLYDENPDDEKLQELKEKIMAIVNSDEWGQVENKLITQELLTLNEVLGEANMLRLRQKGYGLDRGLSEELVSLYDENPDDERLQKLREKIMAIADSDEKWLTPFGTISQGLLDYPVGESEKVQNAWLVEHSFTPMSNEWGKQSLGKIIHTRLTNGVESNLHDATQWLASFRIPEEGYDVRAIIGDRSKGELRELDEYRVRMRDIEVEEDFLRVLTLLHTIGLSTDDWNRVRLSNKPQRVSQMFSDPAMAYIYTAVFSRIRSGEGFEDFQFLLDGAEDYYREYLRPGGKMSDARYKTGEGFRGRIRKWIQGRNNWSGEVSVQIMNENFRKLLEMGKHRQDYVDDATEWLTKHMVAPHDKLTTAWGDRAMALYADVNDNVGDINAWRKKNGFRIWIERTGAKILDGYGMTKDELFGEYEPFVTELTRCYGSSTTLKAIWTYKSIHNEQKICPAEKRGLEHGKRQFSGEVLAHDDPKGWTMGPDTGCCMTAEGASRSCIVSGYRDEFAGFFALYESSGQIFAQSYFYTNQKQNPEVLVMDNIESNAGRDADVIVDLYRDYFRQYLLQRFRDDPNWKIREVHIGTRYGDLVKPIVNRLPTADIVLNPDRSVYTDAAYNQVLLLRLTDEEIAQAKKEGEEMRARGDEVISKVEDDIAPTHEARTVYSDLTVDQAEIMKSLEERLYPPEMRQYDDADFLINEMVMDRAERYSFIINSQIDATREPVGYCLAYMAESEVEPGKNSLYVADFGILKERRTLTAALSGFSELLRRAEEDGVDMIEMDARDATSYRLLMGRGVQRLLERRGWSVEDTGRREEFDNGEETHLLVMRRIR